MTVAEALDSHTGSKAFEGDIAALPIPELLVRTKWIAFSAGEDLFLRRVQE